ncbi:MAG: hypothetical protein LBR29_05435, partial [Methylobacteriaceae bacterium]|nr:hypothetical protein [Methylobacteriaceae bacterium]
GSGEAWLIVGVVLLTLVIGLESAWIIGAGFTKNPAGRIVFGTAVSVYFIGLLWAMYSGVFAPFISTLISLTGLGIAILLFP